MINQAGNNVYGEVEALSVLLGFKTQNAGCCKVCRNLVGPGWQCASRARQAALPPVEPGPGSARTSHDSPPAVHMCMCTLMKCCRPLRNPCHRCLTPLSPALQILLHPQWGSAVYPASMFTRAPAQVLASAIAATEQEVAGRQQA
jgi:hypothetical protein